MAEAVCGPSNALQNFQKHTSSDRTLQQDRAVFRQSPSQGFRTASPFDRALDAEFQVFQAPQILNRPGPSLHPALVPRFSVAPPQTASGWAADFQKLNINYEPQLAFQPAQSAPTSLQASSPLHAEFLAQNHGQAGVVMQKGQQHRLGSWQPPFQQQPYLNGFSAVGPHLQEQVSHQDVGFDDTAFEKAFDEARYAMEESDSRGKSKADNLNAPQFNMNSACTDPGDITGEYDFDNMDKAAFEAEQAQGAEWSGTQFSGSMQKQFDFDAFLAQGNDQSDSLNYQKIGSDTIPPQTALDSEAEADELANTAGQLLDSLKDEKSTKFTQSTFMTLMRQLRDKETKVNGENFEAASSSAHPGGRDYPVEVSEHLLPDRVH